MGRPLTDLSPKFADPNLVSDAAAVLEKLVPIEREVVSHDGKNIYARRILPYRTADNRIDGVVLTFVDITQRKHAEQELEGPSNTPRTSFRRCTSRCWCSMRT